MNFTYGIELEFADVRPTFIRKKLLAGWEVRGDNSIRNSDNSFSDYLNPMSLGSEVKTSGGNSFEVLEGMVPQIYQIVSELGGQVNGSTGLHVHVGFGEWDGDTMMRLLRYFASSKPFGTRVGISKLRKKYYCAPIDAEFVAQVAPFVHSGDWDSLRKKIARIPGQRSPFRERDINVLSLLQHGTVEFRAYSQTMDPALAINCIRYSGEVMGAALTGSPFPDLTYPLPEAL